MGAQDAGSLMGSLASLVGAHEWASLFVQANRLLRVQFEPNAGVAPETLLAREATIREGVSAPYQIDLTCLSIDGALTLACLIGQPVRLEVTTANGTRRAWCGLVTAARAAGADGGFARYELTIESAIEVLRERITSRVFQDQSVIEIVMTILDEHRASNAVLARALEVADRTRDPLSKRSICVQYQESDAAFVTRLLAEEGLSTFIEAARDCVHRIVIIDGASELAASPQPIVRFHRAGATEEADTITAWSATQSLAASGHGLASFDYKRVRAVAADERASVDQGQAGAELAASLEHYDTHAQYFASNAQEAGRYTRIRAEAAELSARTFEGAGTSRELAIGTWFALSAHPRHATDNEFVVLAAEHKIENNLPREGRAAALAFSNRFECAPRGLALRLPGAGAPGSKPTAPGIQSATVVGPEKAVRHTDALGRIKIRYHWPRAAEHPNGGAALDERASQWVRVASMAAGAGFGMIDIPRVGDEVLVMFDGGDIDRPVVVGSLANGKHAPPAFSGASGLPANQALSGWKTNAFDGAGYNELVFDDTAGQLRARLASEQSKSQLNLGYLTHPRKEGTAEPRGEGAELRSDASVAIRGAHGVLLSAAAQPGAAGGQLAREEIIRQLQGALELAQGLGKYAAEHAGTAPDSTTQKALAQAVTHWHQGTNVARDGANHGASGQSAGRAPIVLASGPAGIGMTTPEGMTLHAGKHVDLIAEQNAQIAAAANVVVNAGDAVSVFAHKGGIQQIAHQGKLTLQAQHDAIDIVADKSVRVVSGSEHVAISADKHITLTCGGAYIRLQGGNIEIGGPGRFVVKTKQHSFQGPASMAGETPAFDRGELDRRVQLVRRGDGGFLPDTRYRVTRADGSIVEGVSDAQGRTSIAQSDHFERLNIEILGKGGA